MAERSATLSVSDELLEQNEAVAGAAAAARRNAGSKQRQRDAIGNK